MFELCDFETKFIIIIYNVERHENAIRRGPRPYLDY